jgi:hypothetical protein
MERSPREDKDRDYKRQSQSAARHGLRKQVQRIKAKAHRRYRRAESTALAQAATLADDGVAEEAEARITTTRRRVENRWGRPPTLADHVTERLAERFLDMVDTYSAGPYKAETQRDRTEQALTEILRERSGGRRERWLTRIALDLDALLPDPVLPGRRWRRDDRSGRRREWFTAFLDDRPEWEPHLVHWIADRAPR